MNRSDAIAIIAASLGKLDDTQVVEIAELVQSATEKSDAFRPLNDRERLGVQSAKDDFDCGRTYSFEQYQTEMHNFMAKLADKFPEK